MEGDTETDSGPLPPHRCYVTRSPETLHALANSKQAELSIGIPAGTVRLSRLTFRLEAATVVLDREIKVGLTCTLVLVLGHFDHCMLRLRVLCDIGQAFLNYPVQSDLMRFAQLFNRFVFEEAHRDPGQTGMLAAEAPQGLKNSDLTVAPGSPGTLKHHGPQVFKHFSDPGQDILRQASNYIDATVLLRWTRLKLLLQDGEIDVDGGHELADLVVEFPAHLQSILLLGGKDLLRQTRKLLLHEPRLGEQLGCFPDVKEEQSNNPSCEHEEHRRPYREDPPEIYRGLRHQNATP